ncbi:hypothetical protein AYO38_07525 [bacterium SCGC AG-212-C10]|nr:hypothetical protein AYO38_07525 [bacterium SCGC AG-212-C10]
MANTSRSLLTDRGDMKRALGLLRLSGTGIVVAPLTAVCVAAVVLGALGFSTLTMLKGQGREAATNAQAATLSAQVSHDALALVAALPQADTALTPSGALTAATLSREASGHAESLDNLVRSAESRAIVAGAGELNRLLVAYAGAPAPELNAQLRADATALSVRTAALSPSFAANAAAQRGQFEHTLRLATVVIVIAVAAAFLSIFVTTWLVGRRLRDALARAEAEKANLLATTGNMERRNGQFQALYQIVNEVSETLSLRYVAQTTLREARKLAHADVVELRLLKGTGLELVGTAEDRAADVEGLTTIALGAGLIGRAAKRGKSALVLADAEAAMAPEEHVYGIQSGLVVPLIVGARVVGTLALWSRNPGAFTADDAQVIEMMAAHVATAVVAASTHENSEHEAHHDPLTGLPNRREMAREILAEIDPALLRGEEVSIAMVDIDHFKHFNDEYGHKVGDITLQRVAQVLQMSLREGDSVYRYGGEEFTIILPGATEVQAQAVLDRVRASVAATSFTGDNLEPVGPVTISVGFATGPASGRSADMLIKLADEAMYQSKWSGRNMVTGYASSYLAEAA